MTKEEFSNLGVGKPFALGCRKFIVVEPDEDNGCEGCFFEDEVWHCGQMAKDNFIPECYWENREDEKNVAFIEIEE